MTGTALTRRTFGTCLLGTGLAAAEVARPALRVELGPEQPVAPEVQWPYLFESREGATVLLGHIRWPPGGKDPIHYTSRSFDGRKTWQEWKPGPEHGPGPVTEGSAVQLRDGRILVFDVHAEHTGSKRFETNFWVSRDAFKTLEGPQKFSFVLPEAEINSFDDRGEPVSRMYVRRSIVELLQREQRSGLQLRGRRDDDFGAHRWLCINLHHLGGLPSLQLPRCARVRRIPPSRVAHMSSHGGLDLQSLIKNERASRTRVRKVLFHKSSHDSAPISCYALRRPTLEALKCHRCGPNSKRVGANPIQWIFPTFGSCAVRADHADHGIMGRFDVSRLCACFLPCSFTPCLLQ